jgi:hypothetical protein
VSSVEEIPIVKFDEADGDEVAVFIDLDEPTEEDVLRLYKTYLEGGGKPYEPYDSMLKEHERRAHASEADQGTEKETSE